jgi:hypothetical protein
LIHISVDKINKTTHCNSIGKESDIMSNNNDYDISDSKDCETYINQFIQDFTIRSAEIGKGTIIKRALPSRQKRLVVRGVFLTMLVQSVFLLVMA